MDIKIPKITKLIELRDYAPEFEDATITVWVNPPRSILAVLDGFAGKPLTGEVYKQLVDILAALWGESPEDVVKLYDQTRDTDPLLVEWLMMKSFKAISEHRTQLKKN